MPWTPPASFIESEWSDASLIWIVQLSQWVLSSQILDANPAVGVQESVVQGRQLVILAAVRVQGVTAALTQANAFTDMAASGALTDWVVSLGFLAGAAEAGESPTTITGYAGAIGNPTQNWAALPDLTPIAQRGQ